jgi:plastocyanin
MLHHAPRRATTAAAAIILSACSFGASDSSAAVTGTDDSCVIEDGEIGAGKIDFDFTNEANDVSELYVLRVNGDVVSEVENVTTGTTRTLTVDLVAGEYVVQCKPGQTGDGFSSTFIVTGEGGAAQAEPARTIDFAAIDFTYVDLDLSDVTADETIRFEMLNSGNQPHEFEVLDPDGEALGEVAAIAAGDTGGATLSFESPGVYTYQCILIDADTGKEHTELGMIGTFSVSDG